MHLRPCPLRGEVQGPLVAAGVIAGPLGGRASRRTGEAGWDTSELQPLFLGALRGLGLCSELSFDCKAVESAAPVRGGLWRRVDSGVAGFLRASQCPPSCVLLSEAKPEFRVQSSLGGEPGGVVRVAVAFLKVSCCALHLPGPCVGTSSVCPRQLPSHTPKYDSPTWPERNWG